MPSEPKHTNRLIHEKSPYLLQHAHNPVDWFPWGEAAFDKARREDKMLLVSIGYATCHWCHVMERESFEDEQTAAFLNEHFVAIKVDREERPDVDKIYMDSLHALGQQGGWPLNMFATPDGRPVLGGTYFPPDRRYGRPSFREVLTFVAESWSGNRDAILNNARVLTEHLQSRARPGSGHAAAWTSEPVERAVASLAASFDPAEGGFLHNGPNKFPPSMGLMLLLRHHARTLDPQATAMVERTLRKMCAGGIYDQIGGGLSRYSTDHRWLVPHFEKMLYDNALFVQALTETHLVTGDPFFRDAAEDTIAYVLRDLRAPEGAFYSAEDADSEGVEGKFYLWTPEQVRAELEPEQARLALAFWSISPAGNFEHGASIPTSAEGPAEAAARLGIPEAELKESLGRARSTLLAARSRRVRPLRDDKVLTSWNALMISALAKAGRAFAEPRYVQAASQAGRFILENLRDPGGRLLRRWREGEARHKAYLVDHAQLAVACLDLYESTFDPDWFQAALDLMRQVNRLFRNEEGPYFDTGSDAETLIARTLEGYDGVEPSGNSAAALAFLRLHAYGIRESFEDDALRIFAGFRTQMEQAGAGFAAMLSALDFHLAGPAEVAVVGDPALPETQAMLNLLQRQFHRAAVVGFAAPEEVDRAAEFVPLLRQRSALDGRPTAYLCRNLMCQLPVHTAEELREQLQKS
jgi:uncharacterized protein YyaL (SSP411 family)